MKDAARDLPPERVQDKVLHQHVWEARVRGDLLPNGPEPRPVS